MKTTMKEQTSVLVAFELIKLCVIFTDNMFSNLINLFTFADIKSRIEDHLVFHWCLYDKNVPSEFLPSVPSQSKSRMFYWSVLFSI